MKWATALVCASSLAAGVAGCSGGSSAKPPSGTPPTRPASTSTSPSTTVTPARTVLEQFAPWSPSGSLLSDVHVIATISGGECSIESARDPGAPNAWRCFSGNDVVYDPCFAPPGTANVARVACAETPTSGVDVLELSTPMPQGSTPRNGQGAWYVVLSNGETCFRFSGAGPPEVAGVTLDFVCTGGAAAEPDTTMTLWKDQYAAHVAPPLQPVTVLQAWT